VPTLRELMQKKNFVRMLPTLVGDVQARFTSILATKGDAGLIDPFEDLYEIVYQLTMRTVGATEIAESPAQLKKTLRLFERIEASVSHIKHVFPWLPTVNQYKRMYYGAQLYMTLAKIVDERKKTGTRYEDCAQMLIDQGYETLHILGFVLSALFAGQLNSGINAGWAMIQLGDYPEWRAKLHEEVDGVIANHRTSPEQSPLEVLQTLDVDAWETEFPLIDLILRESIRMSLPGTSMRFNQSGADLPIGKTGEVVPKDGFALFWVQALHSDPSIYPEPYKFDPGRYLPDRAEDKKVPHGYMGWGMGRHPCSEYRFCICFGRASERSNTDPCLTVGMRFAKLEMAIITACFAALFDWTTVDVNGRPFDKLPIMDPNLYAASKPKEQMRLKYTLRATKV
jgi:cytochrome P450